MILEWPWRMAPYERCCKGTVKASQRFSGWMCSTFPMRWNFGVQLKIWDLKWDLTPVASEEIHVTVYPLFLSSFLLLFFFFLLWIRRGAECFAKVSWRYWIALKQWCSVVMQNSIWGKLWQTVCAENVLAHWRERPLSSRAASCYSHSVTDTAQCAYHTRQRGLSCLIPSPFCAEGLQSARRS